MRRILTSDYRVVEMLLLIESKDQNLSFSRCELLNHGPATMADLNRRPKTLVVWVKL